MIGAPGQADNAPAPAYQGGMEIAPLTLLLLLCGPFAGSFAGVLADRLPRGEDVVRAPSACRACRTRLGWRDLVPLWSFAARRGRCRHCGAAIPPWLWAAEIAGGAGAVAAVLVLPGAAAWGGALLLWCLLALVLSDLRWFRLPDPLTAALGLIALGLSLAGLGPSPGQALWGAGLGAGAFAALRGGYRALRGREGLGAGDVKLMAGCGAALGPWDLPLMVLMAATTALAVAGAGRLRGQAGALDPARALPFGAALAAATGALWLARMAA